MKAFKFVLLCLLTFCFSGCFEMNEEIAINNNGGGDYSVDMDMGKMMEMMQAFIPPDQAKDLEKARDTTIQMKDFIDTASNLAADKKALLRDGSLQMQMNMADKVFKLHMKYPFKNTADLQKLYGTLGEAGSGMGSLLKSLNPGGGAGSLAGMGQPDMKMISSYFDLITKKNTISRKLNKERYATLSDDQMMQQIKQMGEMGGGAMGGGVGEVKMNTIIKLPVPAKSITGGKAELSSDKKIVMIKNNLMDIFLHPEVFEFSVNY